MAVQVSLLLNASRMRIGRFDRNPLRCSFCCQGISGGKSARFKLFEVSTVRAEPRVWGCHMFEGREARAASALDPGTGGPTTKRKMKEWRSGVAVFEVFWMEGISGTPQVPGIGSKAGFLQGCLLGQRLKKVLGGHW